MKPDITIEEMKTNELIRALVRNHIVFDFATDYYYKNTLESPQSFVLSQADYKDFVDHVSSSDFSFETRTEQVLEKAMTDREEVIYSDAIEADFQKLLADIEKSKFSALEKYSDEISRQLEDEIIKRYFYREGLYEFYLKKDAAILSAREVLASSDRYRSILQAP